jgi:hypothetical protein
MIVEMEDSRPAYSHSKIKPNHIRILQLNEADGQYKGRPALQGELYQVSIDECRFDALSYVWGEKSEEDFYVLLAGKYYHLTPNCYTALKCLRDHHSVRIIWVDSICINQEDKIEKMDQLQFMKDIYGKASKVHIWLGESIAKDEEDGDSPENALKWLKQMFFRHFSVGALGAARNQLDPTYHGIKWTYPMQVFKALWFLFECVLESECCTQYTY